MAASILLRDVVLLHDPSKSFFTRRGLLHVREGLDESAESAALDGLVVLLMPRPADHHACLPPSAGGAHRADEVPHRRLVSFAGTRRWRALLHQVLGIRCVDVDVVDEVQRDGDGVAGELALEVDVRELVLGRAKREATRCRHGRSEEKVRVCDSRLDH